MATAHLFHEPVPGQTKKLTLKWRPKYTNKQTNYRLEYIKYTVVFSTYFSWTRKLEKKYNLLDGVILTQHRPKAYKIWKSRDQPKTVNEKKYEFYAWIVILDIQVNNNEWRSKSKTFSRSRGDWNEKVTVHLGYIYSLSVILEIAENKSHLCARLLSLSF